MWGGRIARQLGWGSNPLRRASDRLEIRVTRVLLLAVLILSPWAGWQAAQIAYRDVVRSNAWERDHHHHVWAVLIETPAGPGTKGRDPDVPAAGPAAARWTTPDGRIGTGTIYLPDARRAGDTVRIWIDDRGRDTGPPVRRDPSARAGFAALLAAGAVAAGLAGIRRIVRGLLDRRRLRAWQAEWALVEPVWNRNGSGGFGAAGDFTPPG